LRDELEDALSNQKNGDSEAFSPEERAMINNILRLREVRVEDVMVPRADIIAVDIDTTLDELLLLFEESGHSRMPVFSETMDDPRGMVLAKDLQGYIVRTASRKQRKSAKTAAKSAMKLDLSKINMTRKLGGLKLVRKVLFVPPSMLVTDLMTRMQTARTQMALVIDEYGGTDGLVSLEDIVEEVFGEIEDEHDDDEGPMIEKSGENIFTADARTDLDDVAALVGSAFQFGDIDEDVETIGGLLYSLAGRIPARGEVIHGMPGFEFRVLDADPRRIKRLQIVQRRSPARVQRTRRQENDSAPQ
jgi:CBS domain containing-hemolysin-like protein